MKEFTYTGPALAGREGQCVDYTNNAWIKELPAKKASAKVSVCSEADVTVAKDVTATYDTTYHWNITKSVDRTLAEVEPGATAGFEYTVVAEPTTSDDSGWEMGGTITLTNPNTYKDVTVTLSDVYDGGGECTPDSTTVVVPKASKTQVGYSCEFTERPDVHRDEHGHRFVGRRHGTGHGAGDLRAGRQDRLPGAGLRRPDQPVGHPGAARYGGLGRSRGGPDLQEPPRPRCGSRSVRGLHEHRVVGRDERRHRPPRDSCHPGPGPVRSPDGDRV